MQSRDVVWSSQVSLNGDSSQKVYSLYIPEAEWMITGGII